MQDVRPYRTPCQVGDGQAQFGWSAAPPDRDVGGVLGAQTQRQPLVRPAGQPERPERHRPRQIGTDRLVRVHCVPDQGQLTLRHPVQVPGEVDAAQECSAEREGDQVVVVLGLGVSPHRALFRRYRRRGGGGDRRVAQRVLLVAGGLELGDGKGGAVHAHAARGAVLDDQTGVAVEDAGQPVQVGLGVAEQSGAGGEVAGAAGAGVDGDVVVQLEIADAPVADQAVHRAVQVRAGRGMP